MSTRYKIGKFVLRTSAFSSLSWLLVANTNFKRQFEEYPAIYDYLLYTEQLTRQLSGEPITPLLSGLDSDLNTIQVNLKHPMRLDAALNTLNQKLKELKRNHQNDSKSISDLSQAILQQKAAYEKEIKETKEQITMKYEQSIKSMLEEKETQLKQHYDALLESQKAHMKQQFNREVSELVDTERQGKLQKLGLLESELKELEQLTNKVSKDNDQMRHYVDLYNSVNELTTKLQTEATDIELQPFDDFVSSVAVHLPKTIVSFEELQAKFVNLYPQLSKTALLHSQPSLLNRATSFINSQFNYNFSNTIEEFPRLSFWRYFSVSVLNNFIFPWQNELDNMLVKIKQGDLDVLDKVKELGPWPNALLLDWKQQVLEHNKAKQLLQVYCI